MPDLNSLEHFNEYYKKNPEAVLPISLLDFFKTQVSPRLKKNIDAAAEPSILDIGPGNSSIFELSVFDYKNVTAIDFSSEALAHVPKNSNINYMRRDIASENFKMPEETYDLIFDSHCLHCIIPSRERKNAFENIYHTLKVGGIFCAEMMVRPAMGVVHFPAKYVVTARELEEEILGYGFKIQYFTMAQNLNFKNDDGECDLLRVIAYK